MKVLKRFVCLLILTALTAVLAGCTQIKIEGALSDGVLLRINDEELSSGAGIFRLMEVKDSYNADDSSFWNRTIGSITLKEYVKDSVKDELMKITASVIIADKMALYLTEEEQSQINSDASAAYEKVAANHDVSKYGITLESVRELYTKQAMYEKLFNKISEDVNISISDTDTKVIEVNYVEIPLDVSINDAETLRSEIKNGTDFETACSQMGLTPVMDCVLKKGDMPDAFEKVAYALKDGELSELVETGDCMYLIQCKEDYLVTESAANKNKVITNAKKEQFDTVYSEFASTATMRFNDSIWDKLEVPGI